MFSESARAALSGRWAISRDPYIFIAPTMIVSVILLQATTFELTEIWGWFLASSGGYLVFCFLLFLAHVTLYRNRAITPVSVAWIFVIGFVFGAIKGVSTAGISVALNLESNLYEEMLGRALPAGLLGLVGVPFMALLYIVACLYIIFSNFGLLDDAISLIMAEAFSPTAIGVGSVIGVLLVGFKRAAFSNEAGAGSASIAHSAVRTKYSASEGLVALLEPFIDTVVICTMTAVVIVIFNFGGAFQYGGDGSGVVYIDGMPFEGAGITSQAFAQYIPYSNVFLTIAVVLFAVSTMISWSYYGLQSWKYLFGRGKKADLTYKFLFLTFVVIGAAASMKSIWDFSDAMIFAMVFPNMIGLFLLTPVVKKQLRRYLVAINLKKEAIES